MVKAKYIEYTKKRNLPQGEMTPARVKMATLPEKTEPIQNPVGTAPAVRLDLNGTVLFALPGVPSEMEAIFTETIEPLLKEAVGDRVFCEKSMFLKDIMESQLAPLIDKVMAANVGVYIKSHPLGAENKPHIEIHLTTAAKNEDKPEEMLTKAMRQLASLVKENGGKPLPEMVFNRVKSGRRDYAFLAFPSSALRRSDFIGFFPREFWFFSSEVPETQQFSCRLVLASSSWSMIALGLISKCLFTNSRIFVVRQFPSFICVYKHRDWLGNTDGVGNLDFALVSQPCSNNVFGDVSCHVAA